MDRALEAVLLTGGRSKRMGSDKASMQFEGRALADRIADVMLSAGLPLTVLGPSSVSSSRVVMDREAYAGPLAALAGFVPTAQAVVVLSCDLALFNQELLSALTVSLGDSDAAVPVVDGFAQPLCAVYAARSLSRIPEVLASGRKSMMAWLDVLDWKALDLQDLGVNPRWALGANTPEELQAVSKLLTADSTCTSGSASKRSKTF